MNKTLKAAVALFLASSISYAGHAQTVGSPETTVGGDTVYINRADYDYTGSAARKDNGLSYSGAVGLPLNPTAILPSEGTVRVQASYFDGSRLSNPDARIETKYYGLFAAGRVGESPLEISGGINKHAASADADFFNPALNGPFEREVKRSLDKSGFALGAKYQIRDSFADPQGVRLAVGVGHNRALFKNTHAYVVASKPFGVSNRSITAHLGVRYDRHKINTSSLFGGSQSSSKFSVYTGAEVPLDSNGHFNLVGEIGTKTASSDGFLASSPYSLSLRYQSNNGFAVNGGVARQGLLAKGGGTLNTKSGRFFVTVGQSF